MTQVNRSSPEALARTAATALRPLRLGVIGCELGRARYGAALAAQADLKVAGITDPDVRFAQVWARELGSKTPVYADADDLLEQPLDAVLVAVPPAQRAQRIAEALRAGLPTLAEAPFALGLRDMDDLIALAAQHQALLMPALPRRTDPYFQTLSSAAGEGCSGTLQQARCFWSYPIESVAIDGPLTGGWNAVVQTLAVQTVDLCLTWLGDGVSVSADIDLERVGGRTLPRGRRLQDAPLATILVTHTNGHSTHQITRTQAVRPEERYMLQGTDGVQELVVTSGAAASSSAPTLHCRRAGSKVEPIAFALADGETALPPAILRMHRLLLRFAGCVREGGAPEVTAVDARHALEIVHAAFLSTQEKVRVSLPLRREPDITEILRFAISTPARTLPSAPK